MHSSVYEKRCKEAGFSAYFDYSWQWAYRKKFEEAGLTALLGCGFDPGVTQAYCAYAKKHEFDSIDTIVREPRLAGSGSRALRNLMGTICCPSKSTGLVESIPTFSRQGEILAGVAKRTGCRILLAQKAFSNYDLYPVISPYLDGTEASGLYEARLGAEEMPEKEVHVFCAAYREEEFDELLRYADHIVFNSPSQLDRFGFRAKKAGKSIGLRINPECSTQEGHAPFHPGQYIAEAFRHSFKRCFQRIGILLTQRMKMQTIQQLGQF